MVAEAAMYGQAALAGTPMKGTTAKPHREEPGTTAAVSSNASPPGADWSRAFQPACRRPAPSTASVMPEVSSTALAERDARVSTLLCRARLAFLPAFFGHRFVRRRGRLRRGLRRVLEPRLRQ